MSTMTTWTEPFAVVGVNAVGAMPTDRKPLGNKILRKARDKVLHNGGGLVLAVEADDADLESIFDPETWWYSHKDAKDLDGVLIAGTYDRTWRLDETWYAGAPASSVNAPRPILVDHVRIDGKAILTVAARHRPKPQGGAHAGAVMDARLKEIRVDLDYADFNLRNTAIKSRNRGRTVQSRQVVGFTHHAGKVKTGRLVPFDLVPGTTDDDHPGLYLPTRARIS